ncbi:MAG: LysR family transcriptional regulator [Planctomycetota bacterium]
MTQKRKYFKEVRIAQLKALVELADGKGFSSAAAALDRSTPSVWQQVRALEEEFGVPLITVEGHSVTLTEHGARLAESAVPVINDFDTLLHEPRLIERLTKHSAHPKFRRLREEPRESKCGYRGRSPKHVDLLLAQYRTGAGTGR